MLLYNMWSKIDIPNAEFFIMKNVYNDDMINNVKESMKDLWRQEDTIIFGKTYKQPRLTCLLGDSTYDYSGINRVPSKMPQTIQNIMETVQTHIHKLKNKKEVKFNGCLINLYRNGYDSIGKHSDSEKDLDKNTCIASLSLGATRTFILREKSTNDTYKLSLENGDLLVMGQNSQKRYTHEVPKEPKIKDERINITFRQFIS